MLQAKRQDRKVVWVVLNLSLGGASGKDEENTINVCLPIITLVVEEFKTKKICSEEYSSFFRDLGEILLS